MPFTESALWFETSEEIHHARDYRRLLHALANGYDGVTSEGALKVTQQGTPGMGVTVAAGGAVIVGSELAPHQGAYHAYLDAAENVAISAADSTNARIDLVGIVVADEEYSGSGFGAALHVVEGTPSGSPVAPSAPDNFLELARVAVAASASSITNANITDRRRRIGATAIDRWQTFNITGISQPGAVGTLTVTNSLYKIVDDICFWQAFISAGVGVTGIAGNAMQIIISGLPALASGSIARVVGTFDYFDAGSTVYTGSVMRLSSTELRLQVTSNGDVLGNAPSVGIASGDTLSMRGWFPIDALV